MILGTNPYVPVVTLPTNDINFQKILSKDLQEKIIGTNLDFK